jgi:nickel/cobalt transporter (NiCoT) family protein
VIVALVIGSLEALNIVATELKLSGPFWDQVGALDDNFGLLGVLIVILFIASWGISTLIYKLKRYDQLDINMAAMSQQGSSSIAAGRQRLRESKNDA